MGLFNRIEKCVAREASRVDAKDSFFRGVNRMPRNAISRKKNVAATAIPGST